MPETVAVYPGSFDPITLGHMDIIRRASRIFSRVIVTVATNMSKEPMFSVEERLDMIRNSLDGRDNISVDSFNGLLVDYTRKIGANVVVRGLRALTDFEHEMMMALMNRRLRDDLTVVFMMPKEEHIYLSSTLVKTIALHKGPLGALVHPYVEKRLLEKFHGIGT